MLTIQNIYKSYAGPQGTVQALAAISLTVSSGDFVAVRGPSGSGKTTLLLAAGGMLRPDGGRVLIDGQDIYQMTSEARARFRAAHIGFVFQQFHLIPYLTVLENVIAPAVARAVPAVSERGRDLIARVGLDHRRQHRPSELSSGERQRCALARALLQEPGLVLADEPTGNLDEHNGKIVLEILGAYVASGGALLLVTHETRAAERADRVIHLDAAGRTP